MKKSIFFLIFLLFISGCTRQYFEPNPKEITKPITLTKTMPHSIIYMTKEVATLDNYTTLPGNIQLPKEFLAIDKEISKKGNILRINGKNIEFSKLIVTATKRDNLVAILFADNHFELYDLNKNETISRANFSQSLALRKFVARPYFYKDLLLIPTLNGQLKIYDIPAAKIIKSIVVSQKDYFNNIIYLNVVNDNLIVASRDNLLLISAGLVLNKNYNIKHILVDSDSIYVFTIEGKVIKLNFALKEIAQNNFKYANIISPMFYNNKIYFLSRGDKSFLIKLDKSLKDYKVTPLNIIVDDQCDNNFIDLHTNVFGVDGVYYIGDYILNLK